MSLMYLDFFCFYIITFVPERSEGIYNKSIYISLEKASAPHQGGTSLYALDYSGVPSPPHKPFPQLHQGRRDITPPPPLLYTEKSYESGIFALYFSTSSG